MDMRNDRYLQKVKTFINLLNQNGLVISEAYLFGSASRGEFNEDSDIDVAVVSREFEGVLYYDIKKLSKFRRQVDLRLDVHPFSLEEIQNDPPAFFIHIRKEGIRVC